MKKLVAVMALSLLSSAAFAEVKSVTFKIEKMTCVTCPVVIKGALNKLDGVDSVVTDLDSRTAVVSYDDEVVTIAAMQEATKNAGFPAVVQKAKEEK